MAEEMIESAPWESEEAEYSEAEEAIVEAEESEEAYRRPTRPRRYFQPARGIQGITLRGRDGTRSVQFPAKLATVAETNRGLASQELARRALDERLDRLELRFRAQQKRDVATTGVVALAIGGGLSAIGAFNAANEQDGPFLKNWASQEVTKMAAVVAVTQLATSGAKLTFNRRYIRSGLGIAADVFSVVQLTLFTFGRLRPSVGPAKEADTETEGAAAQFDLGTRIYDPKKEELFVVIKTNLDKRFLRVAA